MTRKFSGWNSFPIKYEIPRAHVNQHLTKSICFAGKWLSGLFNISWNDLPVTSLKRPATHSSAIRIVFVRGSFALPFCTRQGSMQLFFSHVSPETWCSTFCVHVSRETWGSSFVVHVGAALSLFSSFERAWRVLGGMSICVHQVPPNAVGLEWFHGVKSFWTHCDWALRTGCGSHMQTLVIYELGFNQIYCTFPLILLTKIVLCSRFPSKKM